MESGVGEAKQQQDQGEKGPGSKALPADSSNSSSTDGDEGGTGQQNNKWDLRTMISFLAVSMFLVPAVRFALVLVLGGKVFTGDNKLLVQLILMLQCVTPAANLVVVVCQQQGNRAAAERLSRAMILQYLCAAVTLMIATTVAISNLYGDA